VIYAFGEFELDTGRIELRRNGQPVPVEPRVFALLCLLVENHERAVSTEEIIEKIWDGRFISDAAVSTAVRGIRRALGDDGMRQRYLRTLRGRGFRFAEPVTLRPPPAASQEAPPPSAEMPAAGRPVVAVLPFTRIGGDIAHPALADAIPAELISSLSPLRWLAVIARGSTFRFRDAAPDLRAIRSALAAQYCLSGTIEETGHRLTIGVELSDTRDQSVLWAQVHSGRIDDLHEIRSTIAQSVVAALVQHIPLQEARLARLGTSEQLDAWSAYHLGLQHMYRFNRADNALATDLFERALRLDPHFARAHAGLSFTHFQGAFLRYAADPAAEALAARRHAERAVEIDPLDPMGNFTLGRALWLEGDPDASLPWLDRAIALNPNFAQGLYARAWADIMASRAREGRAHVDAAMALSPIDPLLYAMLATRAITDLIEDDRAAAATCADRAARAPGAHYLVGAIAVAAQDLAGQGERAADWAARVKSRRPDASVEDFFRAFPFRDPKLRALLQASLSKYGF
jgi:TolB-like protein